MHFLGYKTEGSNPCILRGAARKARKTASQCETGEERGAARHRSPRPTHSLTSQIVLCYIPLLPAKDRSKLPTLTEKSWHYM